MSTNTAGFEEVPSGEVRFRTSDGVDDRHDDFEEVTVLRNTYFTIESVKPDAVAQVVDFFLLDHHDLLVGKLKIKLVSGRGFDLPPPL